MRIAFEYLNHNGKRSDRDVDIDSLEYHRNPGFGYQPGWFVSGWDYDKANRRSFALDRITISADQIYKLIKIQGGGIR